jgi:hypothetical protein
MDFMQIEGTKFWGYISQPLPCTLDTEVSNALNLVLCLPDLERVASELTEEQRRSLQAFSTRMSSLGVREKSAERIALAMDALLLQCSLPFDQETLMALVVPVDACERIGENFMAIATSSASRARPKAQTALEKFMARALEDRSLESMGAYTISEGATFRYAFR